MKEPILKVTKLKTHFFTDQGEIKAVDGVTFTIHKGETIGIVGESGSGKSVTSLSLMRLLDNTSGKVVDGTIMFDKKDLLSLSESEMRKIRGNSMAMIFQEPMTSLNPVYKIGKQLTESIILHLKLNKHEAQLHAVNILKQIGIPRANEIMDDYPHQLSGGMRQRIMIAMAMSCNPKVLIADEPTTALDVTIQAQILDLMKQLRKTSETSILLITHDLGVVAEMCSHVIVMYAGKIVEESDVYSIFKNPQHPYTKGLLKSIPKLGQPKEKLVSISGNVPTPDQMPIGCKFSPRCPSAMDICFKKEPAFYNINKTHKSRCWLHKGGQET